MSSIPRARVLEVYNTLTGRGGKSSSIILISSVCTRNHSISRNSTSLVTYLRSTDDQRSSAQAELCRALGRKHSIICQSALARLTVVISVQSFDCPQLSLRVLTPCWSTSTKSTCTDSLSYPPSDMSNITSAPCFCVFG